MRDLIMFLLVMAEFMCVLYYRKKARIMEEGFCTLANMAYHLKTPEECAKLAAKICEEQNASKRPNRPNFK